MKILHETCYLMCACMVCACLRVRTCAYAHALVYEFVHSCNYFQTTYLLFIHVYLSE